MDPLEGIFPRRGDQHEVGTITAGDGGDELVPIEGVALGDSRQAAVILPEQCLDCPSVAPVFIIKCSPRSGVRASSH
jgi:hypothetical protein